MYSRRDLLRNAYNSRRDSYMRSRRDFYEMCGSGNIFAPLWLDKLRVLWYARLAHKNQNYSQHNTQLILNYTKLLRML